MSSTDSAMEKYNETVNGYTSPGDGYVSHSQLEANTATEVNTPEGDANASPRQIHGIIVRISLYTYLTRI